MTTEAHQFLQQHFAAQNDAEYRQVWRNAVEDIATGIVPGKGLDEIYPQLRPCSLRGQAADLFLAQIQSRRDEIDPPAKK